MSQTAVEEQVKQVTELKQPPKYKVLLHNDDTTTFEFVIAILKNIFHRTLEESIAVTQEIHLTGQGLAGSGYTREIAEEKKNEVTSFSRANGFPLKATFEEV